MSNPPLTPMLQIPLLPVTFFHVPLSTTSPSSSDTDRPLLVLILHTFRKSSPLLFSSLQQNIANVEHRHTLVSWPQFINFSILGTTLSKFSSVRPPTAGGSLSARCYPSLPTSVLAGSQVPLSSLPSVSKTLSPPRFFSCKEPRILHSFPRPIFAPPVPPSSFATMGFRPHPPVLPLVKDTPNAFYFHPFFDLDLFSLLRG